jgi:predicted ATPase
LGNGVFGAPELANANSTFCLDQKKRDHIGLMPLVGRGNELDLLLRRWERARSGEGQVLLLSGEPGIGKSRLTTALLERIAGEPHGLLSYSCSPQHVDSAYYPVIGLVERAAGFGHGDAPQQRLDKLDAYLADNAVPEPDAALFADMLFLRHDGRYPVQDLTPEQQRERTLQALVGQVEMLAQQSPLLIVFEDVRSGLVTLPAINGTDLNNFLTARVSPTLQIVKASVNYRF